MNTTHGGRREGAGRKPGSLDKATIERTIRAEQGIAAALEAGLMPLDVILCVMRGEPLSNGLTATERQYSAAIAAAPYLHPKLSAAIVKDGGSSDSMSVDDRRRRVEDHHEPSECVPMVTTSPQEPPGRGLPVVTLHPHQNRTPPSAIADAQTGENGPRSP